MSSILISSNQLQSKLVQHTTSSVSRLHTIIGFTKAYILVYIHVQTSHSDKLTLKKRLTI